MDKLEVTEQEILPHIDRNDQEESKSNKEEK